VLAFFTIIHCIFVYIFPLAPDECYYWQWSRHLDWGYYDQGPMVAWVIRAGCMIFGDTPFGVRSGIILTCFLLQLFTYLIAKDLFGPRTAFLALVISSITPFALIGSFIATYDPLVVMFYAGAIYWSCKALFFNKWWSWFGVGACLGLGLLSKHTMIFFVPCLFLFLLSDSRHRQWLKRWEVYAAFLFAILIYTPNLVWQNGHDWITFKHLFLLTGKGLDMPFPRRLGDFVGSQIALITPILFFTMMASLVWSYKIRKTEGGDKLWLLTCVSLPVLALFTAMTLKSKVQANWAICGWVTPPIIWVAWLSRDEKISSTVVDRLQTWRDHLRPFTGKLTLFTVGFCGLASAMLSWPDARAALHLKVASRLDQMNKLYGGEELATAALPIMQEMEKETGGKVTAAAVTYDNASRIAFYLPHKPETYCFYLNTRLNSYYLWQEKNRPAIGSGVLIADDLQPDDPKLPRLRDIFDRVVPVAEPVQVFRRPLYVEPVHTFYLYKCYGFRPNPAAEIISGG
ncbi:MAG: glycosyltransferase family 39 protein, partial [Chthonomonadales bacterium]